MNNHPPISSDVNTSSGYAITINQLGKETKFKVTVNVNSSDKMNPVWCILWRGNPLIEIASYSSNGEQEFSFSSHPAPVYVTHWEQDGDLMQQLNINV